MIVASESPGQRGMLMQKLERVGTGAPILECGPDRNVDRNAWFQNGCLFLRRLGARSALSPGERARTRAPPWRGRSPRSLTWRDGGVDHVHGLAIHQVPDLCPCRGRASGAAGARVCMENLRLLEGTITRGHLGAVTHPGCT